MNKNRFKKICIFGATSAIAQSLIHYLEGSDVSFVLFGRDLDKLEIVKRDILARSEAKVFVEKFEAKDFNMHIAYVEKAESLLGGLDLSIIAYGWLPDNKKLESCPELIIENFLVNSYSIISIASIIANLFEKKGQGTLAVITSVAGDRGRRTNYFYGSAKSSLDVFLEGLRHRFTKTNVSVITIKPGIVDTPMTSNLSKNILFSSPETVAKDIFEAIIHNRPVIYSPFYWKYLMFIIKLLPRPLFNQLKF
ncbi:MAG: SDR family NAD(P)-dependent oxidoreductase [Candidatus Kapaibacteriales bacterium]